ncbi:MAG: hypothetical protein DRN20_06745 [Thermoplasmata archaeon]|nr:MAG: hypothetical protein DRN20_06745 [Thermoplasmata archaeon]
MLFKRKKQDESIEDLERELELLRRERELLEEIGEVQSDIEELQRELKSFERGERLPLKVLSEGTVKVCKGVKSVVTSPKTKRFLKRSAKTAWRLLFG